MSVNPADEASRSFASLIATLEDGDLSNDLSDQVREIVAALNDAVANQGGKPKGTLVLKLDFVLDSGVIETKADVKVTKPKQNRRKTVMYATPGNHLSRKNPKQQELPFRDVNAGRDADVRAV